MSASGTGGNWCAGDIGEVLVYNTFLDETGRDTVKTYLATKWLDAGAPPYAAIAGATVTVVVAAPPNYTISGTVELQAFNGTNLGGAIRDVGSGGGAGDELFADHQHRVERSR